MTDVTLADLIQKVSQVSDTYAQRCNIRRDDDWYLIKIGEELGELNAEYLRLTQRGRMDGSQGVDDVRMAMADELADVFAQLLLFAQHNNIEIEDALTRKWFKYLPKDQ